MTDLIQRLRRHQKVQDALGETSVSGKPWTLAGEAADELELFVAWKKVAMEEARCAEKEVEHISSVLVDKDREIERLTRERDEARDMLRMATEETGYRMAERSRLRAECEAFKLERKALFAALQRIASSETFYLEGERTIQDIAREALNNL